VRGIADSPHSAGLTSILPWQMRQWSLLQKQVAKNTLPHALLITGIAGLGKAHFARAFAQWLMCEQTLSIACGKCRTCQLNSSLTHPDLLNVEPEEKSPVIKIEQIRRLIEYIGKTPQLNQLQVVLLGPAEQMNRNAANALLKSLEEPTSSTILILHSHRPDALPATIRSRCQLLPMPMPAATDVAQWLLPQVGSADVAAQLMVASNNRPMAAMNVFDSGMLELYQKFSEGVENLLNEAVNPVDFTTRVTEMPLDDLLALLESLLHRRQKNYYHKGGKNMAIVKRSLTVINEIQQIRRSLLNGTNPNRQLTLERLFTHVQQLGKQQH
jgi:DNA polymerase-3 subunit delta'